MKTYSFIDALKGMSPPEKLNEFWYAVINQGNSTTYRFKLNNVEIIDIEGVKFLHIMPNEEYNQTYDVVINFNKIIKFYN